MGQVVYIDLPYIVKTSTTGHIIYNNIGGFTNYHTHIKGLKTCQNLIRDIKRDKVPDSYYLRVSAMRICMDEKYTDKVQNKIDKDRNKEKFFKVNNGIR